MAHGAGWHPTTDGAHFALDTADAEALHALGLHRTFRRGQRLVFEGTAAGHVVIIESGRVKVVISTIEGDEKILAVRGSGEILGDLSVVSGDCATASVITMEEVRATVLSGSRYLEFLEQRPSLMLGQMRRLIDSLRETNQLLIEQ